MSMTLNTCVFFSWRFFIAALQKKNLILAWSFENCFNLAVFGSVSPQGLDLSSSSAHNFLLSMGHPGCFVGILNMVHYNPHITGYNPFCDPTN